MRSARAPLFSVRLALFVSVAAGCGSSKARVLGDLGAEAYETYCALCHGAEGEGYRADAANALSNQEFLATASDRFIHDGIVKGRPGTSMSAWGESRGGPLTTEEVNGLLVFIRAWQTVPSIDLSFVTVEGETARGEPLYEFYCLECHGDRGAGIPYMSIGNAAFLASASDGFLQRAIAKGRPGTAMERYEIQLTSQGIDDLVALVRNWQVPEDHRVPDLPGEDLGQVVINPDGPEPDLGDDHYVPVDVVKAELDRGAAMVILDTRPPGDYVRGHIPGAVSVPFYAVDRYLDQLPKDRWIVAYCACPHAESDRAAATLEENGYTRVRVLDEGVIVWEQRGYPMKEGAEP